jgi:hypothetical protein
MALFQGCQSSSPTNSSESLPQVSVREAPLLHFRGANSPSPSQPGDTDCNSPAHWDRGTLYVLNSAGHPWRSAGPDLAHLDRDYRRCEYSNQANGGRWIECTWKAKDGLLYGWYHNEPGGICPGKHPESPSQSLTAPRIGAARSRDNGATWEDLGLVLESAPILRCNTRNYYFAGGNGDFSVMLDSREDYLYFFISTYAGELAQQGVAVARMRWKERNQPVGRVYKWHQGRWEEPGLGGHVTPIFPARVDWHQADADAFWGPSVHWNTHLQQYVLLLNRAKDSRWSQEGIYICFSRNLSNPEAWSQPRKILESPGPDRWYPQVMGTAEELGTDKLAGAVARLFVRGQSRWELVFRKPGQ